MDILPASSSPHGLTKAGLPVIGVLIADDHPVLRAGVKSVVNAQEDMAVVAEAGDGQEAIALSREHRPDIVLMDLQMPGMDGTEALSIIHREWPAIRILVMTTFSGDAQAARALRAGASGYLVKDALRAELVDTIRALHAGGIVLPRQIEKEIERHAADSPLSARELAVLEQVAVGSSNLEIANALDVSLDVVKSRMGRILVKLGANDRTHAVVIALRRGIIDL